MRAYLEFEKPLEPIELRIEELRQLRVSGNADIEQELADATEELSVRRKEIFTNLTPWQRCHLARHSDRPYTLDYVGRIVEEFLEFHGDRRFSDDPAIVGGFGYIGGFAVLVVGHQKGRGTKERIMRNFGQPHPEGYRKAMRLMKLAERFNRPVVTFIDTPGAFPGIGAEERGQAEAIATNLMELSRLRTPILSIVIGEGGSGGALALGVADRVYMLEHSVYSVITPEGCAAILWKTEKGSGEKGSTEKILTPEDFSKAASALKITAPELMSFKVIDGILEEPPGGAHTNHDEMARRIKKQITETLKSLKAIDIDELIDARYNRYRQIGAFTEINQ
ncbi:MAG: acetyl-CoA carboxylase carboxyltransferase subunit alpha [Nitrospirae bacterium]|nr:acetyl-CoA carboxylase carboxyltransferase subunit alpha [Nitrospirota bacterium]